MYLIEICFILVFFNYRLRYDLWEREEKGTVINNVAP